MTSADQCSRLLKSAPSAAWMDSLILHVLVMQARRSVPASCSAMILSLLEPPLINNPPRGCGGASAPTCPPDRQARTSVGSAGVSCCMSDPDQASFCSHRLQNTDAFHVGSSSRSLQHPGDASYGGDECLLIKQRGCFITKDERRRDKARLFSHRL